MASMLIHMQIFYVNTPKKMDSFPACYSTFDGPTPRLVQIKTDDDGESEGSKQTELAVEGSLGVLGKWRLLWFMR